MNKTLFMLLFAGIFLCSTALQAQSANSRNRSRQRRVPQMSEETAKKWAALQKDLKKKYPEKYARIETLAKTNLPKAMQELTSLAQSSGMELPRNARSGNFRRGTERQGQGPRNFNRGGFGGFSQGRRMNFSAPGEGMNRQSRVTVEAQLKTKFPEEYAKIAKLRDDAEAQMQALAKKGGLTLPETSEAMQRKFQLVREKYKAEFEEIAKLRQSDPRAAMERTMEIYKREGITFPRFGGGMMGRRAEEPARNVPPPPRRGNSMRDQMALLRKAYPEEMKKIESLRKTDPGAFRAELQKIAKRYQLEHKKK